MEIFDFIFKAFKVLGILNVLKSHDIKKFTLRPGKLWNSRIDLGK